MSELRFPEEKPLLRGQDTEMVSVIKAVRLQHHGHPPAPVLSLNPHLPPSTYTYSLSLCILTYRKPTSTYPLPAFLPTYTHQHLCIPCTLTYTPSTYPFPVPSLTYTHHQHLSSPYFPSYIRPQAPILSLYPHIATITRTFLLPAPSLSYSHPHLSLHPHLLPLVPILYLNPHLSPAWVLSLHPHLPIPTCT